MTERQHDQHDATPEPGASDAGPSTAEQAERIASEATDVRERVRRLVLDSVDRGSLRVAELRDAASEVIAGVSRGVGRAEPGRRARVLDETIEGLSDGFSRAAHATKLAIQEAEGRGQRFTDEDLRRAVDELRMLERMFLETSADLSGRLTDEVRAQAGDVMQHARRTADALRASIESAVETARRHPVQLAGEAAAAGVTVARGVVGSLFKAAGGLLDATGEIVAGRRHEDRPPDRA